MTQDHTLPVTDELLNDLYWNSTRTVDEILAEVGVGKKALYTALQPLRAGALCVDCTEPLFFTNRTHRTAGFAACLVCGTESRVSNGEAPAASRGERGPGTRGAPFAGLGRWRSELRFVSKERVALIGGAATVGMMVGVAAARAMRG